MATQVRWGEDHPSDQTVQCANTCKANGIVSPEGSAKLRWAGRGAGDLRFHSLCGSVERRGWPKFDRFYIFRDRIRSGEAAMGGGGRAAPRFGWQWAQKEGCAQRTGGHARPKPTSFFIRHFYFRSTLGTLSSTLK
jgi:hypothetical protein